MESFLAAHRPCSALRASAEAAHTAAAAATRGAEATAFQAAAAQAAEVTCRRSPLTALPVAGTAGQEGVNSIAPGGPLCSCLTPSHLRGNTTVAPPAAHRQWPACCQAVQNLHSCCRFLSPTQAGGNCDPSGMAPELAAQNVGAVGQQAAEQQSDASASVAKPLAPTEFPPHFHAAPPLQREDRSSYIHSDGRGFLLSAKAHTGHSHCSRMNRNLPDPPPPDMNTHREDFGGGWLHGHSRTSTGHATEEAVSEESLAGWDGGDAPEGLSVEPVQEWEAADVQAGNEAGILQAEEESFERVPTLKPRPILPRLSTSRPWGAVAAVAASVSRFRSRGTSTQSTQKLQQDARDRLHALECVNAAVAPWRKRVGNNAAAPVSRPLFAGIDRQRRCASLGSSGVERDLGVESASMIPNPNKRQLLVDKRRPTSGKGPPPGGQRARQHDPVTRGRQLRAAWSQDPFLRQQKRVSVDYKAYDNWLRNNGHLLRAKALELQREEQRILLLMMQQQSPQTKKAGARI